MQAFGTDARQEPVFGSDPARSYSVVTPHPTNDNVPQGTRAFWVEVPSSGLSISLVGRDQNEVTFNLDAGSYVLPMLAERVTAAGAGVRVVALR